MLSYLHAYHAGNHADVLKHYVLSMTIAQLSKKAKALSFIDTHAGAGRYLLQTREASKNQEYASGISRLWHQPDLPDSLQHYVDLVKTANLSNALHHYPGSPWIMSQLMREQDHLHAYELHPAQFQKLEKLFARDKRIHTNNSDGYQALKAQLPPPSRRGLVLIDPPYEQPREYMQLIQAMQEGIRRFPTGVYMVWYPRLKRPKAPKFAEQLQRLPTNNSLHITLDVAAQGEIPGMHGSALFIINPPWGLHEELQKTLPYLVDKLAVGEGSYQLQVTGD